MYQFSRSIFRELAEHVQGEGRDGQVREQQLLLMACERAVTRLADDPRYFARPARTLFQDVRVYFPIQSQLKVLRVIERHMALAQEFVERHARVGTHLDGTPLACHATTRKGTPCQRTPLPQSEYCPSHQHLDESDLQIDMAAA